MLAYLFKSAVVAYIGFIATNGDVFGALLLGLAHPLVVPILKLTPLALLLNSPRG